MRRFSRLPSTVTAICLGSKNVWAMRCTSGANGLDALNQLVQGEKAAEVHLLAGQVGHAAGGGFQTEHERAFQVVLGAAEFLIGDWALFEIAKLVHDRPYVVHLIQARPGRETPCPRN